MKHILFILFFPLFLQAQVEKVMVETYYISNDSDATDTTGGVLETGSKTYRVYIDLLPGSKLQKIYGDANHALKFSSTAVFFNNKEDGQSFAKDFSKNRYKNNTVALDTWLTLGQVTKTSSKTYFGILKEDDTDGSFVGGENNDGGSAEVRGGLLTNTNAESGIPLTTADGIDTMTVVPANWGDYGFIDIGSNTDSSIFGSAKPGFQFISNNAGLQNSGVTGVIPGKNQVLVAQLTTKGEISFELNVEVSDTSGNIIKYVANGDKLLPGEKVNPNLKYPPSCGCTDPNYLEYNANFACKAADSCKTRVVYGCMDAMACNYNPDANFSIPSLCCYPGACHDLDISLACLNLGIQNPEAEKIFELYPNPVEDQLGIQISVPNMKETGYAISDLVGRIVLEKNTAAIPGSSVLYADVSRLNPGVYVFRLTAGGSSATRLFVKN